MLIITIDGAEIYDEVRNEFSRTKSQTIRLEHSLVSISKWEAKWCKPFLSKIPRSRQENIDYVRCMNMSQNVDDILFEGLSIENYEAISRYIEAPMTATAFPKDEKKKSREVVTSELIYYWMVAHQISIECEKWHLNRLLTLINVCNIKNSSPKKKSRKEILAANASLNESRRKALGTNG